MRKAGSVKEAEMACWPMEPCHPVFAKPLALIPSECYPVLHRVYERKILFGEKIVMLVHAVDRTLSGRVRSRDAFTEAREIAARGVGCMILKNLSLSIFLFMLFTIVPATRGAAEAGSAKPGQIMTILDMISIILSGTGNARNVDTASEYPYNNFYSKGAGFAGHCLFAVSEDKWLGFMCGVNFVNDMAEYSPLIDLSPDRLGNEYSFSWIQLPVCATIGFHRPGDLLMILVDLGGFYSIAKNGFKESPTVSKLMEPYPSNSHFGLRAGLGFYFTFTFDNHLIPFGVGFEMTFDFGIGTTFGTVQGIDNKLSRVTINLVLPLYL
jgi:hypothetical protein